MGNLSKAYFFDAGKNPPRQSVVEHAGTKRIVKIPNGTVERWVNSHGSVVFVQMLQPGEIQSPDKVELRRSALRRRRPKGKQHLLKTYDQVVWIEWRRCPLAHGTIAAEFFPKNLQRPCARDFKPDGTTACAHVEHVIATRRATSAIEQAERHAAETARAELDKRRQDYQDRLNEGLLKILERDEPKGRRGD